MQPGLLTPAPELKQRRWLAPPIVPPVNEICGNTEYTALTLLVAPKASVIVTVNGAGAEVPSDTVVNVPASEAPFKLVPCGSVPPVSPYVYGGTPPATSVYVPHTVTQPCSTAQDWVQRPLAVK